MKAKQQVLHDQCKFKKSKATLEKEKVTRRKKKERIQWKPFSTRLVSAGTYIYSLKFGPHSPKVIKGFVQ